MGGFLLIVALGVVIALVISNSISHYDSSNSNNYSSEESESSTDLNTPEGPSEATEESSIDSAPIGSDVRAGGVKMVVHSAESKSTLTVNDSSYRQGSGFETYTEKPAEDGGKYIIVSTTIYNDGKGSMDLTCGFPVEAVVSDSDDRIFDSVDDLYKIKGNPECNKDLQPGFSSEMTYAFSVPKDATVDYFMFRDTESSDETEAAGVKIEDSVN